MQFFYIIFYLNNSATYQFLLNVFTYVDLATSYASYVCICFMICLILNMLAAYRPFNKWNEMKSDIYRIKAFEMWRWGKHCTTEKSVNSTEWIKHQYRKQAAWPPGATDTVSLRLRAGTQLHRPLAGRCLIGVPVLKFLSLHFGRYYTLLVSAVIELDLWPFDLETGAHYCSWLRHLLVNFDVSVTFRSRLMGEHL